MTFKFKPGVSSSEVLNAIRGAALKNAYNVNQVSENSISVQAGMFTYSADTIQEANSTVLIMNQKPAPAVAVVMILLLLFFIVPGIIFLILTSIGQSSLKKNMEKAVYENYKEGISVQKIAS